MSNGSRFPDLHIVLISFATSIAISTLCIMIFIWTSTVAPLPIGTCESHGWRQEWTGPYQHKHCFDPKSRAMYLPPEIEP